MIPRFVCLIEFPIRFRIIFCIFCASHLILNGTFLSNSNSNFNSFSSVCITMFSSQYSNFCLKLNLWFSRENILVEILRDLKLSQEWESYICIDTYKFSCNSRSSCHFYNMSLHAHTSWWSCWEESSNREPWTASTLTWKCLLLSAARTFKRSSRPKLIPIRILKFYFQKLSIECLF